jgi:hypothetical protein
LKSTVSGARPVVGLGLVLKCAVGGRLGGRAAGVTARAVTLTLQLALRPPARASAVAA